MSYPKHLLAAVRPAMPNTLLVVRDIVAAKAAGGILLSQSYTTGVKRPSAWVLESSVPDYDRGDAILVSVGVTRSAEFGDGDDKVEVFIVSPQQVILRFHRQPTSSAGADDGMRGHKPLPPDTMALRHDRRADEGRPISTAQP